jgi:bacteriorhodopsin
MFETTVRISLVSQFITTLLDFQGFKIPLDPNHKILHQMLKMEVMVQIVEFIFYIWLFRNFGNIFNITPFRYLDWMITTPTMLVQLMAFMKYDVYADTDEFMKKHKKDVIAVLVLNWTMMIIGLLGETNKIPMLGATGVGFVPFLMYYGIIYSKYVPKTNHQYIHKVKRGLFFYYLFVWSLYGVASFMPYILKNSMYNILDVFAKNIYGLFLVWYMKKINSGELVDNDNQGKIIDNDNQEE